MADDDGVDLLIGNTTTLNREFGGILDDVRIYSKALTPDDVKALYRQGR